MNSSMNQFLVFLFICVLAMVISPLAIPDYVNITKQAGIEFKHNNGAFGQKYLPETMGSGSAFIDYNKDGWQDIILVNCKDWPGHPTGNN